MTNRAMVSVIVPCRNEKQYVVECLESIFANDYGYDFIEVLVVDGRSNDGTRELLNECAGRWVHMEWLDNSAQTAPAGLNIGIRRARGEIIMRMDAHCKYPANYISTLVESLERTGADNVGGICRTLPGSGTVTARSIAIALSHPFGVGNSHFRIGATTARWVDTVPFGCYRRSVFERIGLFDEELVKNQDDEFNQRLIKNGGRILLVPEIIVDYYARDSIGKVARMYYQYGYFKPLVVRKLGRVGTARQIIPAAFVASLVITLLLSPSLLLARWGFVGIVSAYFLALAIATIAAIRRSGLQASALLPAIFPVIHFSYGWGSLRGMAHFLLERRSASGAAAEVPISR